MSEHLVLDVPNPLWRVAGECAIYCEPSCCGVGAYELLPQHLKPWTATALPEEVALLLQQADELLTEMKRLGPCASLRWINDSGPNEHRSWLEAPRECTAEAPTPPRTRADGTPFVRQVTVALHVLTRRVQYRGEW